MTVGTLLMTYSYAGQILLSKHAALARAAQHSKGETERFVSYGTARASSSLSSSQSSVSTISTGRRAEGACAALVCVKGECFLAKSTLKFNQMELNLKILQPSEPGCSH